MVKNKEIWGDVVGYEGLYEVSTLGNVRSLNRPVDFWDRHNNRSVSRIRKGKNLSQSPAQNGYPVVAIYKNGKRKDVTVHSIVCETFLCIRPKGKIVNHKDGIKDNNNIDNLEWITPSENIKHAYTVLKKGNYMGINQFTKL